MHHLISYSAYNEAISVTDKIYYHGRNTTSGVYRGTYIYLTESLEYAAGYAADGNEVYSFTLKFPESKLFSIKNPKHLARIGRKVDEYSVKTALSVSTSDGIPSELDWSALSYLCNDDYEEPEELLISMGFKGVKLRERPYADSVLVFQESDTQFIGMVDLRSPENTKRLADWGAYVASKWNHL